MKVCSSKERYFMAVRRSKDASPAKLDLTSICPVSEANIVKKESNWCRSDTFCSWRISLSRYVSL